MLSQEELSQMFPKEKEQLSEKRYSVSWWFHTDGVREVVVVFDKVQSKIVYKGTSKHRLDHRKHIESFYGKNNIEPIKQRNPSFYEGF